MKKFEPITIEINGNTWNIEVQEEKDLPEPDFGFVVLYYKCTYAQYDFIYKMRIYDILTTSPNDGLNSKGKRIKMGLKKAKILFKNKKYENYTCTYMYDGWTD